MTFDQSRCRTPIVVMLLALGLAMSGAPAQAPKASATTASRPTSRPTHVDLRPTLRKLGVLPRPQGPRPTCSVFTVAGALDVAWSRRLKSPTVVSVEYLNLAKNRVLGSVGDGGFFHDLLAGYAKYGVCREARLPYRQPFDPAIAADAAAEADAKDLLARGTGHIAIHWIHPISKDPGISAIEFGEVLDVLNLGWPVATGSGHSRLVVGYAVDEQKPGGGTFISQDSALNGYGEVTFEFIKTGIYDAFWIEAVDGPDSRPQVPIDHRIAPARPESRENRGR